MPIIRQAKPEDIKDIEYICRMTAGPGARRDEEIGKRISTMYSTYYARAEIDTSFVLDDDGKVVGYILCAPDFKRFFKGYRKNEAKQLYKMKRSDGILAKLIPFAYFPFKSIYPAHLHIDLLDGYRGGGNGSKMIQILTEKLKSLNIHGVMLIVDSDNVDAQRFYERNGFHKIISVANGTVMGRKL